MKLSEYVITQKAYQQTLSVNIITLTFLIKMSLQLERTTPATFSFAKDLTDDLFVVVYVHMSSSSAAAAAASAIRLF